MKEEILKLLKQRSYSLDGICLALNKYISYQVLGTVVELIKEKQIVLKDGEISLYEFRSGIAE